MSSNKVNTWLNLRSPGYSQRWFILLDGNPSADQPMRHFLAASSMLMPIVQPLSVTFEMACRSEELPFIELSIPLPYPTWHIHEEEVPTQVQVAARFRQEGHQEIAVERLTIRELEQWLRQAHQQPVEPGYLPTLYALEMHYTRARVFDDTSTPVLLADGAQTYTVPIEIRDDGRWVAGPLRDTLVNPPIKVQFDNIDGRLVIAVTVGWSPWYEIGVPGQQALEHALQKMVAQGWQPENIPGAFDLK